jgi:hypothetical protein
VEQPNQADPVEVPVPSGHKVLVDADDWPRIKPYLWRVVKRGAMLYAATDYKGRTFYLHRTVMRIPVGDRRRVDHRDSNGLDCRKANLRMATHEQNNQNVHHRQRGRTGYIGVELNVQGTYTVRIRTGAGNQRAYVGTFKDATTAARAYDRAAYKLRGEFAVFNFPEEWKRDQQCTVAGGPSGTLRSGTSGLDQSRSTRPGECEGVGSIQQASNGHSTTRGAQLCNGGDEGGEEEATGAGGSGAERQEGSTTQSGVGRGKAGSDTRPDIQADHATE